MISNIKYNKGGYSMNLNDTRLIFVVSPSDEGDKSLETVKEVIGQLIKDDIINCNLKLLTVCQEVYVLPNYELDEICSQSLGIAKLLGLPITYL